jgi:glycosyltransferase involved in cell wall biosynthesis
VLKTIASAAGEAQGVLEQIRSKTHSRGRVILRCEPFDQAQINALHERGDCYLSLHRGEGWGYPLFEAAARGTPVVASAQGGPLDFLDPSRHRLVPCRGEAVQEPYFLFTRDMRWGEPDLSAAATALRWVYEHREQARADAEAAAPILRATYSLERIGEAAKSRLTELLQARSALA